METCRYILKTPETTRKALHARSSPRDEVAIAAPAALPAWRPIVFFAAVGLTIAGLIWLAVIALSPGGFGIVDLVLVVLFAVTLPWYVIGFWNATIGLLIMRFARDPVAAVTPVAGRVRGDEPITASTAILLCIRNEPPERVARLLEPMLAGLAARGVGERFHVYVLSDTSEPDLAAAEDARFAALAGVLARAGRADLPAAREQYRLQGRQCRRFLRALGQGSRLRGDARRRQRDDRRPRAQARAHHADRSAARHPAEPGRSACRRRARSPASSSSACGSACAPTPSAAPGGRAIAGRTGATTPSCASRRSWRTASCRCSARTRW